MLGKESEPLHYAIYVAGVVDDWADLEEVDESRMLHCFKVNTIGPLLTVQALVQQNLLAKGSVLAILTSKVTPFCECCAELLARQELISDDAVHGLRAWSSVGAVVLLDTLRATQQTLAAHAFQGGHLKKGAEGCACIV